MSLADRVQVDGKFKPNVTNAAPRTNVRITRLAVSELLPENRTVT